MVLPRCRCSGKSPFKRPAVRGGVIVGMDTPTPTDNDGRSPAPHRDHIQPMLSQPRSHGLGVFLGCGPLVSTWTR